MSENWTPGEVNRIMHALPHTRDGCRIIPGDKVWYYDKYQGRVIRNVVSSVKRDGKFELLGSMPYFVADGREPVFSSEALALRHWAERKQSEASAALAKARGES